MTETFPGIDSQAGTGSATEYLCVSILSTAQEKLLSRLVQEVLERGCSITECRVTPMGTGVGAQLICAGNWSSLGRLETALPGVARELDAQVQFHRTTERDPRPDMRPYAIEVVAPQRPELLPSLLQFFAAQYIEVVELVSQQYASMHTGAGMCNLQFVVHVPTSQHPPALREAFMDLCDDLNADGMLDPVKN